MEHFAKTFLQKLCHIMKCIKIQTVGIITKLSETSKKKLKKLLEGINDTVMTKGSILS